MLMKMQESNRVEQRLAELVAFDTRNPGGDERPLAEKLARDLELLDATSVEVFASAGHHSTFARFGAPRLLLNAHLDTVPANLGWSSDPLRLERRDGRLYGLGTADTKGAIAAILEALALRRSRRPDPPDLAVLFSGDEELGGACMRAFLDSDRCRGLERAIVCEPTGCQVGVRHRGVYAAQIIATSPGGHSSLVDSVPNPLSALARAAVALDELGGRHRDLGPPGLQGLCMNVAALEGGIAFNVIPSRATLTFSFRPAPGVEVGSILAEAAAATAAAAAPLGTEWQVRAENPAFATRDLAGFAALLGARVQTPVDLPFGTEAGQLVESGIDAVVLGPGRIEQAHKADEYVAMGELEQAVRIFLEVID
jgi:acetylornithine deacetylase